jgi:hypothetical protein
MVNAVIHRGAYEKIKGYIDYAKNAKDAKILFGGKMDDSVGYFIDPTIVVTTDPNFKLIQEEIFGIEISMNFLMIRTCTYNIRLSRCRGREDFKLDRSFNGKVAVF